MRKEKLKAHFQTDRSVLNRNTKAVAERIQKTE
jgi:hypothetical protein